jgi:predicted amidohydrolase
VRIAVGQLHCPVGNNDALLRRVVRDARGQDVDLLVTPELALSGYALAGDTARGLEEAAAAPEGSGMAVVVGFHERAGEATFNSAAWIEDGSVLHVHRKLYLCDYPPFDEHERYGAGDELRAFDTAFGRVAILTCNDAWQPFLPALAAHDGAELLVIPAASSTTVAEAEEYWRDLTRFYARLLQCYVVFANQAGSAGGFTFWGGSHVVDPTGAVVAAAGPAETLLVADVDLAMVAARRAELPLLRGLRPDLLVSELRRLIPNARAGGGMHQRAGSDAPCAGPHPQVPGIRNQSSGRAA